jgi:hypothetical protein
MRKEMKKERTKREYDEERIDCGGVWEVRTERSGKISMHMGRKFENMKTEGEIERKKGSKTERKKKGTQDVGRIDRENARNTRSNTMETASA